MSLDARLRQGMINVADGLQVETHVALVEVRALGRKRERRNIMFAALAGAAAATLLVLAGPRLADQLLSMEVPLQPARPETIENEEIDRTEERRVYDQEDIERANRLGRNREPVVTGIPSSTGRERPVAAGGSRPVADQQPEGGGSDPQREPPLPPDPIQRTASAQYSAAQGALARSGSVSCDGDAQPCFEFAAEDGERYITVSIEDAADASVLAWIQQDVDGDGTSDGEWKKICNSTTAPLRIAPGAVVRVMLDAGRCPDGSDSAPTQGSISVTFSDRIR